MGRKQQNITGGQQGKTHLSEARLGSQGKTDDMEVSQESDNHDNKDTEEYNSFLYWRTPLPDVDIAIAAPVVPQHTAKSAPALHDAHERTAAKSQSSVTVGDIASELSENLAGVDIGMSGGDMAQSKDTDDTIVVHTASLITTEEEPTENYIRSENTCRCPFPPLSLSSLGHLAWSTDTASLISVANINGKA